MRGASEFFIIDNSSAKCILKTLVCGNERRPGTPGRGCNCVSAISLCGDRTTRRCLSPHKRTGSRGVLAHAEGGLAAACCVHVPRDRNLVESHAAAPASNTSPRRGELVLDACIRHGLYYEKSAWRSTAEREAGSRPASS